MFDAMTEALTRRRQKSGSPQDAEDARKSGLAPPAPYLSADQEQNGAQSPMDPGLMQGSPEGAVGIEGPPQMAMAGQINPGAPVPVDDSDIEAELMNHVTDNMTRDEYQGMKDVRPRSLGERAKMTMAAKKYEK